MLCVIDFVENYTFVDHNEVQKAHWHSMNIIILVHIITYRLNPNADPKSWRLDCWKKYIFTFLMMVNMTIYLCSIAYACIGNI
jgi:hypothetical protein